MLLSTVSCVLILSDTLIHRSLAAPASFGNSSTILSTPRTPGFWLEKKVSYPDQPQFDASAMLLLTCQMLYDYSQVPWYFSALNAEQSASNICIGISTIFHPKKRHKLFENRHAMWALWLAAMQQARRGNRKAGVFGLSVSTGDRWTQVAIITYSRDPNPLNLVGTPGNQTTDLTSRSNEPRAISDIVLPPGATPTNDSAISFMANSSVGTSPYLVVLRQAGPHGLTMVGVFNTIAEAMIQRASMPDRGPLTGQWFYSCQETGYKIGLRPPKELSEPAYYQVVLGGMANLLKAMHLAMRDTETAFDVQTMDGALVLQGILIDERAGEAGPGVSFS